MTKEEKIIEAFEKYHPPNDWMKYSARHGIYMPKCEYSPRRFKWLEKYNAMHRAFRAGALSRDEEIESMKCCGNCGFYRNHECRHDVFRYDRETFGSDKCCYWQQRSNEG